MSIRQDYWHAHEMEKNVSFEMGTARGVCKLIL